MTRRGSMIVSAMLIGFACLVAYRVIALRLADQWAHEAPERALRWISRHPAALFNLAERQLEQRRYVDAAATARRLIAVEPLEGRAWRVLAQAAAGQGRSAEAERFYRIAVRRAPRDPKARMALLAIEIERQRFPEAVRHIDMLVRTSPRMAVTLYPVLIELAAIDDVAEELARRVAIDPPWRPGFLAALQADPTRPGAQAVLSRLGAAGELTDGERQAWITGLMGQGKWGEAYARWASGPDMQGLPLTAVFNGAFDREPGHRGFDWQVDPVPGVEVSTEPFPGSDNRALRVAFFRRRVADAGVGQTLVLAPGRYRFEARARGEDLVTERGLEWAVGCQGQHQALATSPPMRSSQGWMPVAFEIQVPLDGCPAQWLRLRNAAVAPPLQQASGTLWLDDVRIFPTSAHLVPNAAGT